MSWHDLIDDDSVRRFVAGDGGGANNNDGSSLYDTELVEDDDGITIVSSVPASVIAGNNILSTVMVDSNMTTNYDDTSLSLHPSSVDSSILTDDASLLQLSDVVTEASCSSMGSPVAVDRESEASIATEDGFPQQQTSSSLYHLEQLQQQNDKNVRLEQAAKEWFLKSNNNADVDDWEREKESILRVLYAVDGDRKDPDRLLAELLDEEEKVWRQAAPKAVAAIGFWDMALVGAVLSLATAVLIKVVRGR